MNARHLMRGACGAIVLAASLAATTACVDTSGRLYVRLGPPAPIIETRAVAPGPGYVWIAGYQRWDGARYVWVPGRWALPPRPRARWVQGRWSHNRRGWYYVDGHWR